MGQLLNPLQGSIFVSKAVDQGPPKLLCQNLSPYFAKYDRYHAVLLSKQGIKLIFLYILDFEFVPYSYTSLSCFEVTSQHEVGG